MQKIISIICYVIAGFFLFAVSLISFFNAPHLSAKLIILSIFSIPTLIMFGLGLALRRFRTWQRDIAIVLLSVSGFTVFGIISFLCLSLAPEFKEFFPDNKVPSFFNDYFTGASCVVIFICAGVLLLLASKKRA